MFRYLLLIVFGSYWSCALASEKPLRIWLSVEGIEFSAQTMERYKTIVEDALQTPAVLSVTPIENADIKIVDSIMRVENDGWETTRMLLDIIPSFSLVSLQDSLPPSAIIGFIKRPHMVHLTSGRYPLDDMNVAADMLAAGRIDAIMDYTENAALYQLRHSTFKSNTVRINTDLRIAFRDKSLAVKMDETLAGFNAVSDKELRLSEAVKNIDIGDRNEFLNWYLIAKQFDPVDNKLYPTQEDMAFTKWLEAQWPDVHFNIVSTNLRTAYKQVLVEKNSCVVNTRKKEAREDMALYSDVSFVFLDFQVYVLAGSKADQRLSEWQRQHGTQTIDFMAYFTAHQTGLIGYYQYLSMLGGYKKSVAPIFEAMPDRFIEIKVSSPKMSVDLLNRGACRISVHAAYNNTIRSRQKRPA